MQPHEAAASVYLRYARSDLLFKICERGKTRALLSAVRPATAERVEGIAMKRV